MLLAFMYHRIGSGKHANTLENLRDHLIYLRDRYPIVLPGDALKKGLSVCLTFDDATYDFYKFVFPLLRDLQIRALLGVPARYILEKSEVSDEIRLNVPYTFAMQDGFFETKAPFCTWEELREMVESGLVEIASHSYAHCNLTFPFVNLDLEIIQSKGMIEKKIGQSVSTFIYPFGRHNKETQRLVSKYYPFAFRIGTAGNWGWGDGTKPLCRIPGDHLTSPYKLLGLQQKIKYFFGSFKNFCKN